MSIQVRVLVSANIVLMLAVIALAFLALAPRADAAPATPYRTMWINYLAEKKPGLSNAASCGVATTKQSSMKNQVRYSGTFEPSPFNDMIVCQATFRVVP